MTVTEVKAYYRTLASAAKELGVTRQAVNKWRDNDLIPFNTQYRIEVLTNGELKADRAVSNAV